MFQLSLHCEKCAAARHNSIIGNQLLFANNRNRVHWVVLCLSQDGASTDSFENFCENSLKGDLSNDINLNPFLFSLVNTFKGGKTEKNIKNWKFSLKTWGSFSFLHVPTLLFDQCSCQSCHTLFGGHDCQTLFISVEFSSPDCNFDSLRKSFLPTLKISESQIWYRNYKDLDFTRQVDFFLGSSPKKMME